MRLALLLLAGSILFPSEWPRTVPERTSHHRTSTVAEVEAFMGALARRDPALKPYRPAGAPIRAEGGGPLRAWRLAATSQDAVRVYLNGNIHAGEVEGKEALQQLVRELLQGKHPALRRHLDLVVVPAYNPDATDALDPAIRP
ncbi:MAG TPA: M14 family zinc carboxypeptidase, partial [Holophaga sp.]|nr:M14 family zinc carboxypeptidase [Holophaga sp.]